MPEVNMRQLALAVCFLLLLLFIKVGYAMEPIVIEIFYYEPCATCPSLHSEYEIYLHNNQVVEDIQSDYGSKVSIERIHFYSEEGTEKIEQYSSEMGYPIPWNAIVINYERLFPGYVNETYARGIVDAYLHGAVHNVAVTKVALSHSIVEVGEEINITVTVKNVGMETESFDVNAHCNESLIGTQQVTSLSPNHSVSMIFVLDTTNQTCGNYIIKTEAEPVAYETSLIDNVYVYGKIEVKTSLSVNLISVLMLAFSLGFFESFSPCLIVLLSFVLGYTLGEEPLFKESFLKVMIFGIGFVFAALLLGIAFGLFFLSMPTLQFSLTWGVCIFSIIFGLNLLGLLEAPFQTKPLIRKLARKYVITYTGLLILGFIFYFLDPCIAPILVSIVPLLLSDVFPLVLLVFSIGTIIPFVGIGIFAGSVSKLATITYKQRFKIKAISGLILIGYALYLVIFYLLPKLTR